MKPVWIHPGSTVLIEHLKKHLHDLTDEQLVDSLYSGELLESTDVNLGALHEQLSDRIPDMSLRNLHLASVCAKSRIKRGNALYRYEDRLPILEPMVTKVDALWSSGALHSPEDFYHFSETINKLVVALKFQVFRNWDWCQVLKDASVSQSVFQDAGQGTKLDMQVTSRSCLWTKSCRFHHFRVEILQI